MRLLLAMTVVLGVLAPAAHAAAPKPKLAATVQECRPSDVAAERFLRVVASMPATSSSASMRMQFELQQRSGTIFKKVKVPTWAAWVRSDPKVPAFVVERQIDSLMAPATYRVEVRFRWYNAARKLVKSAVKRTKTCRMAPLVSEQYGY